MTTYPKPAFQKDGTRILGHKVTRLEDLPLVTGRGRFAADINFPRQLHMRIARASQAHGRIVRVCADGARTMVRKLAPAATRRLARRLFTDEALKRQVVQYLSRYHERLEDTVARDRDGRQVEALLSSEAGRTYLLFDAAAGDLA